MTSVVDTEGIEAEAVYAHVKVDQSLNLADEPLTQLVGIIFEKRRAAIGGLKRAPMYMPPVAVGTYHDVGYTCRVPFLRFLQRHGESLYSVGSFNRATVERLLALIVFG